MPLTRWASLVWRKPFWFAYAASALPPAFYVLLTFHALGWEHGLRWTKNNPAFSLYALLVQPVLAGYLVRALVGELLRNERIDRRLARFLLPTLCALAIVAVHDDMMRGVTAPPHYFADPAGALRQETALRSELPTPRQAIIIIAEKTGAHRGRDALATYRGRHASWKTGTEFIAKAGPVAWVSTLTNLVSALFSAALVSYIVLLLKARPVASRTRDTVVMVFAFALTWFPCRLYSDWYASFYSLRDDLVTFGAFWTLATLALAMLGVLAAILHGDRPIVNVIAGVETTIAAALGIVLAMKPALAAAAGSVFEGMDLPYVLVLGAVLLTIMSVVMGERPAGGAAKGPPDGAANPPPGGAIDPG